MPSIMQRLRTALGTENPTSPPVTTTAVGVVDPTWDGIRNNFFSIPQERTQVYRDMEEMEDTVDEFTAALDILAYEAVNAEHGSQRSFRIVFDGDSTKHNKRIIEDMLDRVNFKRKAYAVARDLLTYGDNFMQNVVDYDRMELSRLMYMPPDSMVRNEDQQGLLVNGSKPGEFAFEQYFPGTNNFIAGFLPWQITHLRWNHRGSDKYGRPLGFTARVAWRKLQAMEEAMCINWLTRAFARLLFELDITGKSEEEAKRYINEFKASLQSRKMASGVQGTEIMSIVKDIHIGKGYREVGGKLYESLNDVRVLDTSSTGFTNLNPIEYYRNKMLTSFRVPHAYLGLEKDINSKATLYQEDKRFSRAVRSVQSVLSDYIEQMAVLELLLHNQNPYKGRFTVEWPNPSGDDQVDASTSLANYAQADAALMALGVIDAEFIATNHVGMTDAQWIEVSKRVQSQVPPVPSGDGKEVKNDNGQE